MSCVFLLSYESVCVSLIVATLALSPTLGTQNYHLFTQQLFTETGSELGPSRCWETRQGPCLSVAAIPGLGGGLGV